MTKMKTTISNTLVLFFLPVLMVLSCSKDIPSNPQEMDFAAASFSVGIKEKRCYKDYSYALPQDEPPVVTAWNTVTLRAESNDAAFNGVNVSSSNPSVVSVERTEDPAEYSLVYRSDGKADIRVWNAGEEESFRIEACEAIELEGLLMRVDGREFVVKADSSLPEPYSEDSPYEWTKERFTDSMVCFDETALGNEYNIEIVDIVPENCSWRGVERLLIYNGGTTGYDRSNWFDPDNDMGVLYTRGAFRDVSDICGKSVTTLRYSSEQGTTFNARFLIVTFRTRCRDFSTPQKDVRYATAICVMKVRR